MRGQSNSGFVGVKLVLFFMLMFGGVWWLMNQAVSIWSR
jgi:hypothetical protein